MPDIDNVYPLLDTVASRLFLDAGFHRNEELG